MALRDQYDLRLSVKDLAGLTGGSGWALAGNPFGHGRMAAGQRVHDEYRAVARREHEGYEQEVTVRWIGECLERRVMVEGRADGLYADAGTGDDEGVVIQEIKSIVAPDDGQRGADQKAFPINLDGTRRAVAEDEAEGQLLLDDLEIPSPVFEAYRWQCALYCHFFSLAEGRPVRGELVLVDVRTLAATVIPVAYDAAACAAFVSDRLDSLLRDRLEAERLAEVRREISKDIRFPHASLRPHQESLMDNVGGALESGMGLLVSAPTGIGKTAAALTPLVRGCLAEDRRLMVVTAKIAQQELALDTLEQLLPDKAEIVVAQLEAKERSCPKDEMICAEHSCKLLRNAMVAAPLAAIARRLARGGVFRAPQLRLLAAEHALCPFEVGLLAAGVADATVCDFNYAFHPQATLERFFAPGGRERVLLIDEAHNLPARARDFLSHSLLRSRVRTLAEGCMHGAHPVFQRVLDFLLEVDELILGVVHEVNAGPCADHPETPVRLDLEAISRLEAGVEIWMLEYLAWAKSGPRRPPAFIPRTEPGSKRVIDPFISFCYDLLHFFRAASEQGDHMTTLLRRRVDDGEEAELRVFCKDPSRYLASRHRQFRAVVAMSATLEPLPFFADILGLARLRRHASCAYPSPFPQENRRLVIDPTVSTRYKDREGSLPEACATMAQLAQLRPGNYLAFFPSYTVLQQAALFLRTVKPAPRVVCQERQTGAEPVLDALREAAVERELGAGNGSLVGAVVIGGALSEGVDYPGELAVGAFVFGPGLPAVTTERKLMQEYYERAMGSGFEYAFLYPGLSRVVQAAGRVIRGPTDRGVIVLFGARFAEERYRSLLPGYWQEEAITAGDCLGVVRDFWSRTVP